MFIDVLSPQGGIYRLMCLFVIILTLSGSPEVLCVAIVACNSVLHHGFLVVSFTNLVEVISLLGQGYKST